MCVVVGGRQVATAMCNGCSGGVVAPEPSELALVAGAHVLASLSPGGEWLKLGGPGPPLQGAAAGPLRRLAVGSVTPPAGFTGGRLGGPEGPSARGVVFNVACLGSGLPLGSRALLAVFASAWSSASGGGGATMLGPSRGTSSLKSSAGGTYESM